MSKFASRTSGFSIASIMLFATAGAISVVLPPPSLACVDTGLTAVEIGHSLDDLLGSGKRVLPCGPYFNIAVSSYWGSLGKGYVLCEGPTRGFRGRRVLIIDGLVKAIKGGVGMAEYCSWGRNRGSD